MGGARISSNAGYLEGGENVAKLCIKQDWDFEVKLQISFGLDLIKLQLINK